MLLHEAIFKTGAKWRNPQLFELARQLQKTDLASKEEYKSIQAIKLEKLFTFFKAHSPYYREILPSDWSNPHKVLRALPILSKAELHAHHDDMQCYEHCGKSCRLLHDICRLTPNNGNSSVVDSQILPDARKNGSTRIRSFFSATRKGACKMLVLSRKVGESIFMGFADLPHP